MTSYPPPPPSSPPPGPPGGQPVGQPQVVATQAASAPGIAWLVPLAAIAAIVGGVLPWFRPIVYFHHGQHRQLGVVAHAWQGGAVGVIGPVLLVIIGIMVFRRIVSKAPAKPGKNPIRRLGFLAVLFAILTYGLQLAARGLILHATVTISGKSYKIDDLAGQLGYSEISRGTQIGFWIVAGAAALALIGGFIMMIVGKKAPEGYAPPAYVPQGPPTAS